MRAVVIGHGSALPKKIVTNHDLAQTLDTSDEWIRSRTGIHQRHVCGADESTSSLATSAARHALGRAGITADVIDLIVVATTTPDYTFPAVANLVQHHIGARGCAAIDVQNACNGFIAALSVAHSFMQTGQAKTVLVIGVDVFSRIVDWQDRNTAVLFGDGAGALVLQTQQPSKQAKGATDTSGLIGFELFSDGAYADALRTSGGAGTTATAGYVLMNGREVFKQAVRSMGEVIPYLLAKHHIKQSEINWLVPHQANVRIIESIAKMVSLPMERVVITLNNHANTSAASIPLALDVAARDGRIRKGDLLLLVAFGAGFAWGGGLLRW